MITLLSVWKVIGTKRRVLDKDKISKPLPCPCNLGIRKAVLLLPAQLPGHNMAPHRSVDLRPPASLCYGGKFTLNILKADSTLFLGVILAFLMCPDMAMQS